MHQAARRHDTTKARAPRRLVESTRRLEARAKPLSLQIERWLLRYARHVLEREASRAIRKAPGDGQYQRELENILRLYGMRTLQDAATEAVGSQVVIEPRAIADFIEQKRIRITGLMRDTRQGILDEIRRVLIDANKETVQPSVGTIAQRIRGRFLGDEAHWSVSPERAALIARTETAQAMNTGIFAGYAATQVDMLEWLAYPPNDPKSDRGHFDMNGTRVALGEMFTLPDGTKLRYPGDPNAPIKHTANCRCTVAAVRN